MLIRIALAAGLALTVAAGALAQTPPAQPNTVAPPGSGATAPFRGPMGILQMPTAPASNLPPNMMMDSVSAEAKMNAMQSFMMMNPMSLRQMMNLMVAKKKAEAGISFDDVIESMKVRANKRNFKLVGHNPLSKDVAAISGNKNTPRVEIFSFCDAMVAREIVDAVPEFIAFLPCRIAVLEDAKKEIWLVTLDWDVRWLDTSNHPDKLTPGLREKAINVRDAIDDIMTAGAKGEL